MSIHISFFSQIAKQIKIIIFDNSIETKSFLSLITNIKPTIKFLNVRNPIEIYMKLMMPLNIQYYYNSNILIFIFQSVQFYLLYQQIRMLQHIPLLLLLFMFFSVNNKQACSNNCQSCSPTNSTQNICYACINEFELTENGICVSDKLIKDCSRYDKMMNCVQCRPTFQLRYNSCQKMFTGCLIFNSYSCEVCLPGGYNSGDGGCLINYLNCIMINQLGQCSKCPDQYSLQNGKCIYNNRFCLNIDKDTGQCSLCSVNSVMIGSSCIPLSFQQIINNCYFANIFDNQTNCQLCKEGYVSYFGSCLTLEEVITKQKFTGECKNLEYIYVNKNSCVMAVKPQISLNKCLSIDFGYKFCLICDADYILLNGTCVPIRNNFCLIFQTNSLQCKICKLKFHNKNGICYENPLFCNNYTDRCNSCVNNFQLINGQCRDPNCRLINTLTRLCRVCMINYRLNSQGVCKFIDPNCQQFNIFGDCSVCLKNFVLRSSNKICAYQDMNCITYDDSGACSICKPFFYYNENVQLCIPLPTNCQKVQSASGRCSECLGKFTLISNYQCIFIPKINNCNIVNRNDYSKCFLCTSNYFSNQQGICQKLPKFCLRYDTKANRCLQCSASGVMINKFKQQGVCLDKNCQFFDDEQNCLACLPSYQFDGFGECILMMPDSNCRQFMYGICKSCTQRYYFNSQFVCTPVSPLCKEYDSNSGYCIDCYEGYLLTDDGECVINFYTRSMAVQIDILDDYCKTYNQNNECIQCQPGFQTVKKSDKSDNDIVNCIYGLKRIGNSNCLENDRNNSKCIRCVARMYVDQFGSCKGIDPNCQKYNMTSGICIKCYPGFINILIDLKMVCTIDEKQDPNCQSSNDRGCSKCYNGYYFSVQMVRCVQVNALCQTYNSANGNCLTCFAGYSLTENGSCNILTVASNINDNITISKQQIQNCLHYESKDKCKSCEWGYALINNSCIKKDVNCQIFVRQNSLDCLKCYGGYKVFSRTKLCVLDRMVVQKCSKYSNDAICQQCINGYVLNKNTEGFIPPYSCQKIDQNCQIYNSVSKSCDKCSDGTVHQGRACIVPLYGIDANCFMYAEGKCIKCKQGWKMNGHLCSNDQL